MCVKFITVTNENLQSEHICCAISSNQKDCQVASKKKWLTKSLDDGLVFLKGDARGKCFIEYMPAENAWMPIDASEMMYINCFWVSGQFQGQGYANELLESCIRDSKAKGKKGLVILSSKKKLGFLCDSKFLIYKGFQVVDVAAPYFQLLYLPFEADSPVPQYKLCVKKPKVDGEGFVLFYTQQCPFTAKYVPLIEAYARENGIHFESRHLQTKEEAQNAPTPFTTYTLFYKGKFVTHEILSLKKFKKIFQEKC